MWASAFTLVALYSPSRLHSTLCSLSFSLTWIVVHQFLQHSHWQFRHYFAQPSVFLLIRTINTAWTSTPLMSLSVFDLKQIADFRFYDYITLKWEELVVLIIFENEQLGNLAVYQLSTLKRWRVAKYNISAIIRVKLRVFKEYYLRL